jgi:predicted acyltransferase
VLLVAILYLIQLHLLVAALAVRMDKPHLTVVLVAVLVITMLLVLVTRRQPRHLKETMAVLEVFLVALEVVAAQVQ